MGGGVMKQQQLFPLIRKKLAEYMNGYVDLPDLEGYIVPPGLGDDQESPVRSLWLMKPVEQVVL